MISTLKPLENPVTSEEWSCKSNENYFLLLNLKQQIVTLNDAFASFMKVDMNGNVNRVSKNIFDFLPVSHHRWFQELYEMAKRGQSVSHELLLQDELGNDLWIRFDFSPFYNLKNEVRGISCIGTNVNKEKHQEKKLGKQNLLLKEIASTYSHELRHPLTNILAIINIMKQENYCMDKIYFEYLEIATMQLDAVIRNVVLQTSVAA